MTTTSTRTPSSEYPFPADRDAAPQQSGEQGVIADTAGRMAEAAASAREQLADAALEAQARAEAFRDTAAGYIQCYPFRSVLVSAAMGFLVGILAARLPR